MNRMGENLRHYLDNMVCCEMAAGRYFGDDKYIAPATAKLNELLEWPAFNNQQKQDRES